MTISKGFSTGEGIFRFLGGGGISSSHLLTQNGINYSTLTFCWTFLPIEMENSTTKIIEPNILQRKGEGGRNDVLKKGKKGPWGKND
ncbi:hypothetical protein T12_10564 [Trichinella patagoniensis]|uniref:Uncharacterized protein n=1 Tax=Trichinella patagoniensis TaxID=990121 RepID=A0A0V0ZTS4_9BILA|nr:hypothetical protein T12_10564 [Trichinella patagoniensis]